jgi:periplasmic protein TonB
MFKVLDGRKRRVISPTTVIASIAAHVLLLGGAVYAAASDPAPRERVTGEIVLPPLPTEPPVVKPEDPTPPPPAPPQPSEPDAPAPVPGEVLQLETPSEAPQAIKPEPPGMPPVNPDDYRRDGRIGDVIGEPPATPTPPAGNTPPAPPADYVLPSESAEVQPLLERDGLARTMERYYPSVLRDGRVAGRVIVEMVVDENGRVRANSARVVESTHPAFSEATLRAVERFRFSPAKMAGVPVPVRVTIPINWTVPR